jgi:large subunit ribosomal protein L18
VTQATGATFSVHFRRRRQGRTDYSKRLGHLKSHRTRMIARKTNKFITVAFADFDAKGDAIRVSQSSRELKKMGFAGKCNSPSAYLTGYWTAKQALKKGVKEAIFDIGMHPATKGSVLFAALKGAVDAGMKVPYEETIMPSQDRIQGKHLGEAMAKAFEDCKRKIDAS